jgi:hypothetical protein
LEVAVARSGTREYRQVAFTVLRWYLELDSDTVGFDSSIVSYRVDVAHALAVLSAQEQQVLMSIHRDGLTAKDATSLARVTHSRPDEYVTAAEVKLGRELRRRRLEDVVEYLTT